MKKLIVLLLAAVMVFGMVACGNGADKKDDMKVGFIFLHDEQSTYDKNFIDAAKEACQKMGVTMVQKTQIPESQKCYDAAVELIETEGCEIIFADSFGHESFLLEAAKKYPDVQFCHATGTQAHTAGVANFHNAFASIYQGRYAAGVVAGLKLNEMIASGKITADKAKMGYVGAFCASATTVTPTLESVLQKKGNQQAISWRETGALSQSHPGYIPVRAATLHSERHMQTPRS